MINTNDFYNKHGLSDESIKLLLQEYHPLTYIPFLSKYITKELYETHTDQVSVWLNMIYYDACCTDMSPRDLGKVYHHALTISDFKFKYTSGHYLDWFNIIDNSDTPEFKFKVLQYLQIEIDAIYKELRGWPGMNNLNFRTPDHDIIKELYPTIVENLIDQHATNSSDLYFVYRMLQTLIEQNTDNAKLDDIKQASLLMFGHQSIEKANYPLLKQIGQELYGEKFEHLYKIGEGLGLLGNKDFWKANLHQITSYELPELSFNN